MGGRTSRDVWSSTNVTKLKTSYRSVQSKHHIKACSLVKYPCFGINYIGVFVTLTPFKLVKFGSIRHRKDVKSFLTIISCIWHLLNGTTNILQWGFVNLKEQTDSDSSTCTLSQSGFDRQSIQF